MEPIDPTFERRMVIGTRLVVAVLGAALGFQVALLLFDRGWLAGPNNLLYVSLLGFLTGYLVSGRLGRWAARMWLRARSRIEDISPEAVLAAGLGATVALVITVLVNSVLANVPGFTWYWSLLIAGTLVVATSWFFVVNRRRFAPLRTAAAGADAFAPSRQRGVHLIDTSAIIDGRVVDVVEANFLAGELLVPRFVLAELQNIADSDDPLRRKRGRRGLEVLDALVAASKIETSVIDDDPAADDVDHKLIRLCRERGVDLVTTDYNLSRIAAFEGIRVQNLNQLANAVKAVFLPGERLSLTIVKQGREPGQGLAYLEDGTMVVVEDAADRVGHTVDTVVTSSLQTNMGRMIFARPGDGSDDADAAAH